MLRKPAHLILYLSTLHKPAAGAGLCNVLKYKADTFYLSTIQKPALGYESQWISWRMGVMCSYFGRKVSILAAMFWKFCSFSRDDDGRPYGSELQ